MVGDKWFHGHKCKLLPNVHLLQQETEENNVTDSEEQPQQEQTETVVEGDQAMFISAFAVKEGKCLAGKNIKRNRSDKSEPITA